MQIIQVTHGDHKSCDSHVMCVLQNALLREQELESKLVCMQEVIVQTCAIAKESMIVSH